MQLHGKRIVVMGLGVHGGGLGVARFLASQGADVTVTDLRGPDALASSLAALEGLPIRLVLGEHREQDFAEAEIVVRNPGVPHHSRFLQIARAAGARIEMEMSLFFRLCPAPILGITGTKGKTTTTMLTAAMVREQFPGAVVAGNLRISALEQLPSLTAATPVILELSSFALEGLGEAKLSPPYAAITNLTPDHLDRYGSMQAYAEAKRQIYAWQGPDDVLTLNADDPGTLEHYYEPPPGKRIWFSAELPATPRDGAADVGWRGNELIWRAAAAETALLTRGDVRLPGQHNRVNVAAAAALAFAFGVQPQALQRAARGFVGVEHRLELIRMLDGVRYINDTAATVPEAAIAALESFDAPIVLIAGGADKNLAFERFAAAIRSRVKALVLLNGTATPKLVEALAGTMEEGRWTLDDRQKTQDKRSKTGEGGQLMIEAAPPIYDDFEEAVRAARRLASPGDIVLLSPGCASFGMFRNEFHRGEEFRRIVGKLEAE